LVRIVGAVIGAAFGLLVSVAFIRLLSGGNLFGEAFLLLTCAPVGLLLGAFAGAIVARRTARRFGEKSISDTGRSKKYRLILGLVFGVPTAFVAVAWIAQEAVEPPSDEAMLRHFYRHESEFDTLVKMAGRDKGLVRLTRIGPCQPIPRASVCHSSDLHVTGSFCAMLVLHVGFQYQTTTTDFTFFSG
jgi:hypothetical protein